MEIKDRLENYGVVLSRLTEEKIELVRNWRNDPKISQYMEFRGFITPEMQARWFNRINNKENLYYLILYRGEEIGLINLKDIDYQKNTCEAGVFIYEDRYLNTDISYRAHLVLFDYAFSALGIKEIRSHIIESNTRASRFAQYLGSEVVNDSTTEYSLEKERYYSNRNRNRFIKKQTIMTNREKYNAAFCDTLQVSEDQLQNLKYQAVPLWDSVGHMSLVAALEDAFDIMMETDDIIDLSSYEKGKEILNKYGVEF